MKTQNSTRHMNKVKVSISFFVVTMLLLSLLHIGGCAEGNYDGMELSQPAQRVLLFEIEGTDGPELTKMLATKLTDYGIVVVHGSQFEKPSDLMSAAKMARDNQAQSFVMGEITQNAIVDYTKYTISGTFTVHDVETGDQIGGLANATLTEDVDRLLLVTKTYYGLLDFISKEKGKEDKILSKKEEATKVKSAYIRLKFADHVAEELSSGLGIKPATDR